MSIVISRMREYLEEKGISVSKAESLIGVSNGTLSKPFNQNKTIKTDTLEKFLNHFAEINPAWLFSEDDIPKVSMEVNEAARVYKLKTDRELHSQQIPLYNLEASAGLVSLFADAAGQTPIDYISIPNLPKCDGALTVAGDSMYPLLKSGDIVAYKEIHDLQNDIFWGEMYLVSLQMGDEEYVSVKWVQKSDKGETHIRLVSENQHHQPKDVPLAKVRAMALVKASIRINSMR